jgi:hypothetical protein
MMSIEPPVRGHECDCGNPKPYRAECCVRCGYLDHGIPHRQTNWRHKALVVSILRGTDGLSLTEICGALGLPATIHGTAHRSLHRTVSQLVRDGRLRRYERVEDSGKTCWVYILDGLDPRAWVRRVQGHSTGTQLST